MRHRARGWIVMALPLVLVLAACDWSSFRYNPAHTGYNATESAIGVANVAGLSEKWTAADLGLAYGSPSVSGGIVYAGGSNGRLRAFDANGTTGCSGTPTVCTPLWSANTNAYYLDSSAAVANGVLYIGSRDNKLYAFDAAGSIGCSGTPKFCDPLWTAATGDDVASSPTVAKGVVYVGSADNKLYAFDAAGITGCSGTPKTCVPLWTAATGAAIDLVSPAVANGVVYVGSADNKLYAFDSSGTTGCSGTPKTCTPLWTAATGGPINLSSPAVADGVVYVGSNDGKLYAFDATGTTGCGGTPTTCTPLWTATTGASGFYPSSPAVAHGVVYLGSGDGNLYAFDAAGATGCSGAPKACTPLWTAAIGTNQGALVSSPAVANGVVYIGSRQGDVSAFDAAGDTGCTGTPKTCTPLWSANVGSAVVSSPSVANGRVYVVAALDQLHTFGL